MSHETGRPPINNPGGEHLRFVSPREWPTEEDNRRLGRAAVPISMEDTVELPLIREPEPRAGHLPAFKPPESGEAPVTMPVWARSGYDPNRHQEQELPVAPPLPESPSWAGLDHAQLDWPSAPGAPDEADRT